MELIVPDDQLAKAIGRRGQNVRLAAQLTGWKIDIFSEQRHAEMLQNAVDELSRIEALDDELVDVLVRNGFQSAKEVADAEVGYIASILEVSDEDAQLVIDEADDLVGRMIMEEAESRRRGVERPAE